MKKILLLAASAFSGFLPSGLFFRITEQGDSRITEQGDNRVTEYGQ